MLKLEYTVNEDELTCCICYDVITIPIYECTSARHLLCSSCKSKIEQCPICKISEPKRNIWLEELLKTHMVPCPSKCSKLLLPNGVDEHSKICQNKKVKCPLCDKKVTNKSFPKHIMQSCSATYIAASINDEDDTSIEGVIHLIPKKAAQAVNMKSMIALFKWNEEMIGFNVAFLALKPGLSIDIGQSEKEENGAGKLNVSVKQPEPVESISNISLNLFLPTLNPEDEITSYAFGITEKLHRRSPFTSLLNRSDSL